ncbi:ribosome biogenesis factor YjgA [Spartinivicinus poritis]|uniref:Dual-action ribosomal maturation protein DarP n=1 Tax=Spartinivicinus poritis TaxID=2994640 RepID=A0ABT5U8N1_9GAMM|nr:ribosome biogenesis factor YjgA [Spartinivicinus sp. A2-2]MDE1462731.1 DUF615 domain-containing protein [Spartinivicinus sp. A2-2]
MSDNEQFDDEELEFKSKTQVKKEMHALQAMGERLITLPAKVFERLPLTPRLREALEETKRITSFNARKRHFQFIGKLMRDQDLETIQNVLNHFDTASDEYNRQFHLMERWRDRLLAEGNTALAEFVEAYPAADRQHLRQLIRNALKEQQQSKPPAGSRKLFRYIRDLAEEASFNSSGKEKSE